jgi:hypothetical protein
VSLSLLLLLWAERYCDIDGMVELQVRPTSTRSIGIDESVCGQYENLELEKGH